MPEPTLPSLPSELPVLPLRRTVAFPLTLQPLAVNRPVSVETVNRALAADRLILLLLQDKETDDPGPEELRRVGTVGVTSGASAPEKLVARVCDWFRARGVERIEPYQMVDEDVTFRLPVELRRELALAEAQA